MQHFFAPQLFIPAGIKSLDFYTKGLGAVEIRKFLNDDGSIHVAELTLNDCLFHLHEERKQKGQSCPEAVNAITTLIGFFTDDVDAMIDRAVTAGAELLQAPQDYDYGYRQGEFKDPFGHQWLIQKKI